MENNNTKLHWDQVYAQKKPNEVSWTQAVPSTSLEFINNFSLPKTAKIIDIGGGDSKLVDYLLSIGYIDITVLDISKKAIDKAKLRLGKNSIKVKWVISNITNFMPKEKYDVWHDRATFHFLTTEQQIKKYLEIANNTVDKFITIGTFSDSGPDKCSGLEIEKYSEIELENVFKNNFKKIKCINEDHITPFETIQNFTFCSFSKK